MSSTNEQAITDNSIIKRLPLPERGHLYSKLSGFFLVSTQEEFQEYLGFDTSERRYTDEYEKSAAIKAIMKFAEKEQIDFEQYYLLGVFSTQTSGMVKVSMNAPVWLDEETIYLKLNIDSPLGGNMTDDMAYYGFVYAISKSVQKFKVNNSTVILSEGIPESELSEDEKLMLELLGGGF